MVEKCRLAKILADNVGLGIAHLKLRESMRNLSIRDSLTGLFNRRYMEEALAQEEHRTRRNAQSGRSSRRSTFPVSPWGSASTTCTTDGTL